MPTRTIMPSNVAQRLAAFGRELETSGHLLWAEWVFRQVTRRGPPSSTAYYLLGRIQTRRGKLTEGKESFAKGLVIKPDFYHCRVGFFGACRDEYWRAGRTGRRVNRRKPDVANADISTWSLRDLHRLISRALPTSVWYEVARFETEDMDRSVFDTLAAMQGRMKGRPARALGRQLSEARDALDRAIDVIQKLEAAGRAVCERLQATVTLRDGTKKVLSGFRDGDDLVGSHLEIIHDGKADFLPMESLKSVHLGRYGEFTDVEIRERSGRNMRAVMPAFYYASRFSGMTDLRQGNVSMFKELYRGIHVGVGRRVFRGTQPGTDEATAVGVHEIEALEFTV